MVIRNRNPNGNHTNNFNNSNDHSHVQQIMGLKYNVVTKWISNKILSIKLFLEALPSNYTVNNLPQKSAIRYMLA